jgi:hypothetical protein
MGLAVRKNANDSHASMAMTLGETGGRQARFRTRNEQGNEDVKLGDDYTWLPVWFRLQRAGDVFTVYQSSDGIEWFAVGESKISMPREIFAGLLVSGGGNPPGARKEDSPVGNFDHVSIGKKPPTPPPAPEGLKATSLPEQVGMLGWKNPPASPQEGVKVEASVDGAPFCEIADLAATADRFENTGIRDSQSIRYRVRAYNCGGYSSYSNTTP